MFESNERRLKMAKKRSEKKMKEEEHCESGRCYCRGGMIRIGAMSFILFLVTVWTGLGRALLSVPWWVYLIIWAVFCGSAMRMRNRCWCCKK
jgi:hypothetical protein